MACILLPVANFRFECVCGKVEWGGWYVASIFSGMSMLSISNYHSAE